MTLYIESSKDSTRKVLELIHKFSKVAGYKINIQKSAVFLYTNNGLSEKEIKKTFIIASKIKIYLSLNLTKVVKDVRTENYKTLLKGIEEETNKWKDISCSWSGKISIVKMSIPPKPSIDSMKSLSIFQ